MFWLHEALHWIVVALGIVAGVVAILYIPGKLGSIVAAVGFCFAAGSYFYDAGFRSAHALDEKAALHARIVQAEKDAKTNAENAEKAAERERAAVDAAAADQQKVQDYAKDLDDCRLTAADLRGLLEIGNDQQRTNTPVAAAPVRGAGAAARSDRRGRGAKASLAAYRAALAEANRRLVNDRAFWNDFKKGFQQ